MEDIKTWFTKLNEEKPEWENIVNKITKGISDRGFDSTHLDKWINSEIEKIEYGSEINRDLDNENQKDKDK